MLDLLKKNYAVLRNPKCRAVDAFKEAKRDAERGRQSWRPTRRDTLEHGDVIRVRDITGERKTLVIAILDDDDATPPWERSEGHGTVTEWTTRDKEPGERVLNQDGRAKRFYDFQGACALARKEWGLSPKHLEELEQRLGRKPTRREIAAQAAEQDFQFMQEWCNDSWRYIGVALFEMPRDGEYRDAQSFANSEPFAETTNHALWGIESCSEDYIQEVIRELAGEFC